MARGLAYPVAPEQIIVAAKSLFTCCMSNPRCRFDVGSGLLSSRKSHPAAHRSSIVRQVPAVDRVPPGCFVALPFRRSRYQLKDCNDTLLLRGSLRGCIEVSALCARQRKPDTAYLKSARRPRTLTRTNPPLSPRQPSKLMEMEGSFLKARPVPGGHRLSTLPCRFGLLARPTKRGAFRQSGGGSIPGITWPHVQCGCKTFHTEAGRR